VAKFNPITYFKEVKVELKQVTWPKKDQIIRLSTLVVVASTVTAIYLGSLDYIFIRLLGLLLNRQ
jgi:preprotein translocase subunit SecE